VERIGLPVLLAYWNEPMVATNLLIFFNLLGALLLGLIVGYERSYHGRAAGMRTYGLVCMASAALTIVAGYPHEWFGGNNPAFAHAMIDPTRTIQGIVTGIGFLGAGIIMKDGMNISGLTTAASIWASSAIGVLVGLGFYPAAIMLTLLSAGFMMWGTKLESWLPTKQTISVVLLFKQGILLQEEQLDHIMQSRGYTIAKGSLSSIYRHQQQEWQFVAVSTGHGTCTSIIALSSELPTVDGIENCRLARARN
jgi:putative Mg2+ transporter-C (MgtC) family protein